MGIALFFIFLVASIGAGFYTFKKIVNLVGSMMVDFDVKKEIKNELIYSGITAACFTLMLVGIMIWNDFPCDGLHWFKLIAGGLLFGFTLITAIQFFILHYYGKNIDPVWKKRLMYFFIGGFVAAFLTLWLWLDGFAPYLQYPLINGIKIDIFASSFADVFSLWRPSNGGSTPTIAWYAICILCGAGLVYFMCDHFMYKEYGKHGILESTFFVAFPAGIIGARLWFCIGEGVPIGEWIQIWKGGLTILGGAIMGILAGVLWFIWRNKKYSIWVAIDCIVPTILIAQAIGRFGNFFNCEVHGAEVSVEYFKWLPEIIRNNMAYSCENGFASSGMIYVPLFFIEALVNVFGYFFIAHFVGKKLRKVLEPGDLGVAYVIWYGLTRVVLEPFRDTAFNMGGESGYWSWMWSLIFVFAGALAIIGNHVVRYILKKRANNYVVLKGDKNLSMIEFIAISSVAIVLIISAIRLFNLNTFTGKIGFDGFNIGIMFLVLGVSILLFDVPAALRYFESRKIDIKKSDGEVND